MSPQKRIVRRVGNWPPAKCEDCGQNLNFHNGEYFCVSPSCNQPKKVHPKKAAGKKAVY